MESFTFAIEIPEVSASLDVGALEQGHCATKGYVRLPPDLAPISTCHKDKKRRADLRESLLMAIQAELQITVDSIDLECQPLGDDERDIRFWANVSPCVAEDLEQLARHKA